MARILVFALCLFPFLSFASEHIGRFGEVYPVAENSLLDLLKRRLSDLNKSEAIFLNEKFKKKVIQSIKSPKPVPLIRESTEYRVRYFDPSVYIHEDITDINGNLVLNKGSKVNPLHSVDMKEALLFINGENEEHIHWAVSQGDCSKWILVKGKPLDLEKQVQRPVYFDQAGVLCKKLSIVSVPCRVSQDGDLLKIEEIPFSEGIL